MSPSLALLLALAAPASAAPRPLPAVSRALQPYVHVNGVVASRYLWQPSLRREGLEYLYVLGLRLTALKEDSRGLALQGGFHSFDTRRPIKGFAATGLGTMAAEPVFNFGTLYLEGYVAGGGRRLRGRFGVQPLELPTFQLPLASGQIAHLAGARADLDLSPDWRLGYLHGNFRPAQTHEVAYKIEGVAERYNYLNGWAERSHALGSTRAGFYAYDPALRGYRRGSGSLFLQQETPLLEGRLIPRLYGRYLMDRDRFTDVAASVEGRLFRKRLSLRPGFIHRDPGALALPNSNYFAPGVDRNLLFLYVDTPLPRATDSLYAAVTTGAKRFMAQQGTRLEAGLFLRFPDVPGLP